MACLLLYIDASPSFPLRFATLHANRQLLSRQGMELGPTSPWMCEFIPSHNILWSLIPKGKAAPAEVARLLEETGHLLEKGRDVLLFSTTLDGECHNSLERLIRLDAVLSRHEVRCLLVVGRPACVLEQRYRGFRNLLAWKQGLQLVRRLVDFPSRIADARHAWGRENVSLLADLSDSPTALSQDSLSEQLFAWLGCAAPEPLRALPRYPLFLASQTARRLSWTNEVRDNAWPALDESAFMKTLLELDSHWGEEAVSPLNLREQLNKEGEEALRNLEQQLSLKPGELSCPDWLAMQPETSFDAPLPEERVRAFATALPAEVRRSLRLRFQNDALLLTSDQQMLQQELSHKGRVEVGDSPALLTVLTMTYNHEHYIADCLESVLAQRTSFPVQHIVLDHHSTDDTPAIVAAYAEKYPSIRPVLLSCRRIGENVRGLFLRCRTKYAALCDGDDYFTDPLKLQRQVEYLEANPHCSMCFHPVQVVYEGGEKEPEIYPPASLLPRNGRRELYLADLFRGNPVQTNSAVYRWRFREGLPTWFRPGLCPGDWYWHLLHAEVGKIGFLPQVMAVYRRHKAAVYYQSRISRLEHRRQRGLSELRTYWAVNEHFKGRYFLPLAHLADGVLSDFLRLSRANNDCALLDDACKLYPEFSDHFLKTLRHIQATQTPAGL